MECCAPSNGSTSRDIHKNELIIRKTFNEQVPLSGDDRVMIQELRESCCLTPIVDMLVGIPLLSCNNTEL